MLVFQKIKQWTSFHEQSINQEIFFINSSEVEESKDTPKNPVLSLQDTTDPTDWIEELKKQFYFPKNADFQMHTFQVGAFRGIIIYLDTFADPTDSQQNILAPLLQHLQKQKPNQPIDISSMLSELKLKFVPNFKDLVNEVALGGTVVHIYGYAPFWIAKPVKIQHRAVSTPQTESVVRGPHEGFIEDQHTNLSLVRKYIKTKNLVTESIHVGQISHTTCSVLYVEGICNPRLYEEVKRRIKQVDYDVILDSGMLEQFIQDHKYSLFPTIMSTERPDRCAAYLSEGHVIVLVGNSPMALIMPITFFALLHSPEDLYLRWPYGAFIRIIRYLAMFSALLLPGGYIAATNFHPEMIPTDLLMAFASARENLPFPSIVEVLIMETSFELIREAGIRVPTVIGPTIGIVGALILGQAAVQANIISPILVIIVSITGLGSFTIPNISFNYTIRMARFIILFLASVFGFLGIAIALSIGVVSLVHMNSFGVPMLAPLAPYWGQSKDTILAKPLQKQTFRPPYLRTLNDRRLPNKKQK